MVSKRRKGTLILKIEIERECPHCKKTIIIPKISRRYRIGGRKHTSIGVLRKAPRGGEKKK